MQLDPGPDGYTVPGLALVDEDYAEHRQPYNTYPPEFFHLVVEVTSANWRDDVGPKTVAYARAGIAVYVLVDRHHGEVRLLTRPGKSGMRDRGTGEGQDFDYHGVNVFGPGERAEIPGPVPCEVPVDTLLRV